MLTSYATLQNEHKAFVALNSMLQKLPRLTGPFIITQHLFTALMKLATTHQTALKHFKQVQCLICNGLLKVCGPLHGLLQDLLCWLLIVTHALSQFVECCQFPRMPHVGQQQLRVTAQVLYSVHALHALFSIQ